MEPAQESFWKKILRNKYVWLLTFFAIWMLFLDNYSWLNHRELDKQRDELIENKKYLQEQITRDSLAAKRLQNLDQVEKLAREEYYMKRDSEDVYIIEFEGDTVAKP